MAPLRVMLAQSASPARFSVLLPGCNDNGCSCAFYDRKQLCLLRLGHVERVERLLKVIQKGLPLLGSDHEMPMGIIHRTPAVVLGTTCSPANHFGHQVFEPC